MSGKIVIILCLFALLLGCKPKPESKSTLSFNFKIEVDGTDISYHSVDYENLAGNKYQVDEVKFFISGVRFHAKEGQWHSIQKDEGIHYFDSNLPNTYNWMIDNELNIGNYDSVSFIFGLPPEQNVTGYFVNPPENNMAWPELLGGGYHYMQINGKWLNTNNILQPFNLHTGIGQIYENGQVAAFVHNHFSVTLPMSEFVMVENEVREISLVMNVNDWFNTPNQLDWNEIGGSIMQNQPVQELLRANGPTVFSLK